MLKTPFEDKVIETYNRALGSGVLLYFENTVINKVEEDIEVLLSNIFHSIFRP